jgi:hypothetical protein
MKDKFVHECEDREKLIHALKWLKNKTIDVIVAGGWLFNGTLGEIDDGQVILCDVTVTSCGGLTLNTFEVPRVTICLDALISLGKPASLPEL